MRDAMKLTAAVLVFGTASMIFAQSRETLIRDAQWLASCTQALESSCVIELSHVESYETLSTSEFDFASAQPAFFDGMRRHDMGYLRFQALEPWEIFEGGSRLYSFVPYEAAVRRDEATIEVTSYFVAISEDDGESWQFFDGSHVTADNIRLIIPIYSNEPLPPVTRTVLVD